MCEYCVMFFTRESPLSERLHLGNWPHTAVTLTIGWIYVQLL